MVELNPQRQIKTSCKEFRYDLILNLIHFEKKIEDTNKTFHIPETNRPYIKINNAIIYMYGKGPQM
jgi:transposase-like protein